MEDDSGAVYFSDKCGGAVYRITPSSVAKVDEPSPSAKEIPQGDVTIGRNVILFIRETHDTPASGMQMLALLPLNVLTVGSGLGSVHIVQRSYKVYAAPRKDIAKVVEGASDAWGTESDQILESLDKLFQESATTPTATAAAINAVPQWYVSRVVAKLPATLTRFASGDDPRAIDAYISAIKPEKARTLIFGDGKTEFGFWEKRLYTDLKANKIAAAHYDFNKMRATARVGDDGRIERAAIQVTGLAAIWKVHCTKVGERTERQETRGAFGLTHTGWMTVRQIALGCSVTVRDDAPFIPKKTYALTIRVDTDWEAVANGEIRRGTQRDDLPIVTIHGKETVGFSGKVDLAQSRSSKSMGLVSFNGEMTMNKYNIKAPYIVEAKVK